MTYTRAGTSPLIPIRSLSDGGNASPLLKMGSFIKGIDFLRHISTRNILPPIVLVEIHLRWLKHPFTLHNGVFLIIVIKIITFLLRVILVILLGKDTNIIKFQ